MLKDLRKSKKLSQKKVAKAIGINKDTLRNIESGKSSLNAECIPILSKLYETSENDILKIYLSDRSDLNE